MRFLIVTHTNHTFTDGKYYAYGPYVKEMDLWLKYASCIEIVAPLVEGKPSAIALPYKNQKIVFNEIPAVSLLSFSESVKALCKVPIIFFRTLKAMGRADHIHLRCPGNIGLIGCIAQIFFPRKTKTAKYAGNWDPSAIQPKSYRLQKWILSNTFLTKNMQVLVYGNWPRQSKNIKPFFTATYSEKEIQHEQKKAYTAPFRFLFVGTLSTGKQPLFAIQLIERLLLSGIDCRFEIYGDGAEKGRIETYITENKLEHAVLLFGNQNSEAVKFAYQRSHFLVLPSKSEGWPKVVAEAMFWGVIPIVTAISCVPWMLGDGKRGILLQEYLDVDVENVKQVLDSPAEMEHLAKNAKKWSQHYTLEYFETEIKKLLK